MSEQRDMKNLWADYVFLTSEMFKFTDAEDIGMFEDLLDQRATLLEIIQKTPDEGQYTASADGQAVIKKIAAMDDQLREKVLLSRNNLKKSFTVSSAYDGFAGESVAVGNRFDSKSYN